MCWQARGQLDEAMAEFRRAIELDPKGPRPTTNSACACRPRAGSTRRWPSIATPSNSTPGAPGARDPGRGAAPERPLRRGPHGRSPRPRRGPAETPAPALREKLELCERMLALDARLPALLQGKERPAAAEQLELAHLCQEYGRPHAAAGLYAAAFAARPALADDLDERPPLQRRLRRRPAAADLGPDGARLGETERASLRRQALDWLRADLAWGQIAARRQVGGPPFATGGPKPTWRAYGTRCPGGIARRRARRVAAPLGGRGGVAGRRPAGAGPGVPPPAGTGPGPPTATQGPSRRRRPTTATSGSSTPPCCCCRAIARATPGPAPHDRGVWQGGGPRAYHVARACTLAPDAVADASLPGRLAEKELQDSAREFWSLTEQGALAYRAGRFQKRCPSSSRACRPTQAGPCGAQLAVAGPGQSAPREGRGGAALAEQGPGVARSVP